MRTSPWLVLTYTVIIVIGLLIALPNALPQSTLQRLPTWLPHEQVSLGLDLRGGSHLVLEVDEADLTKERLQSLLQDARRVLREKGIQPKAVVRSQNQIVVTLADAAQSDAAVTELRTLANPISTGLSAGQADLNVTANGATVTVGFSPAASPPMSTTPSSRALKSSGSASTRSRLRADHSAHWRQSRAGPASGRAGSVAPARTSGLHGKDVVPHAGAEQPARPRRHHAARR